MFKYILFWDKDESSKCMNDSLLHFTAEALDFLTFWWSETRDNIISQLRGASLLIVMATIISIDLSREHKLSKNKTNIGKDYGNLKSCNRARINQT